MRSAAQAFGPAAAPSIIRRSIPTLSHAGGFSLGTRPAEGRLLQPGTRTAASAERALLDFLQSTYEAAADAGKWDRAALECAPGIPGVPRAIS
jgi:hypothetical protein